MKKSVHESTMKPVIKPCLTTSHCSHVALLVEAQRSATRGTDNKFSVPVLFSATESLFVKWLNGNIENAVKHLSKLFSLQQL